MFVYEVKTVVRYDDGAQEYCEYGFADSPHEVNAVVAEKHNRWQGFRPITMPTVHRIENMSNIGTFDPECVFATIEGTRAYTAA